MSGADRVIGWSTALAVLGVAAVAAAVLAVWVAIALAAAAIGGDLRVRP
jgi:hypothetical protein